MTVTDGPDHPLSGRVLMRERLRAAPGVLLGALFSTAFVLAYPFLIERVLERVGVRCIAVVLGCLAVGSTVARLKGHRNPYYDLGWVPSVSFAGLAVVAAVQEDRTWLLGVPAIIYLAIAWFFFRSLRDGSSIIERMARLMEPTAPEFIGSFCRKVTGVWTVLFVLHAIVIAYLALAAPIEAWRAYTGWIAYAVMGALTVVEYCVRKWWFRNYFYGHIVDRIFSALFPAEATAVGRRSLEHMRRYRSDL